MDVSTFTDMDLVLAVDQLEGMIHRTFRYERKGEIETSSAEQDCAVITTQLDQIVAELKGRTGLTKHDELRQYVKEQLANYDWLEENNIKAIWKPGTVIVSKDFNGEGHPDRTFETVTCYTMTQEDGRIAFVRDRQRKNIGPVSETRMQYLKPWRPIGPIWQNSDPIERGIILREEMGQYQRENKHPRKWWNSDSMPGDVFYHEGLEEDVEYYNDYYKHGEPTVLVRLHETPGFAELSEKDSNVIHPSRAQQKFFKGKGNCRTSRLYPYDLE